MEVLTNFGTETLKFVLQSGFNNPFDKMIGIQERKGALKGVSINNDHADRKST